MAPSPSDTGVNGPANGQEVNPRGQGPRGYGSAARRFDFPSRLGRRAIALLHL